MRANRREILIAMGAGIGTLAIEGIAAAETDDLTGFRYDLITDWLADVNVIAFGVNAAGMQPIYDSIKGRKNRKNFDKQYLARMREYTKLEISKRPFLQYLEIRESIADGKTTDIGVRITTKLTLKKISDQNYIGAHSMDAGKFKSMGIAEKIIENRSTQPVPFSFYLKETGNIDDLVNITFDLSLRHVNYVFELLSVGKQINKK
jgi:hypothetical protein